MTKDASSNKDFTKPSLIKKDLDQVAGGGKEPGDEALDEREDEQKKDPDEELDSSE